MNEPAYLGLASRLTEPPSDLLASAAFGTELLGAPYLHPLMGFVDAAHVAALCEAKIIDSDSARELVAGIAALSERDAASIDWDPAIGDVYNNRDALLRAEVGSVAAWLSTGRARREATTGAWVLAVRERLVKLHGSVVTLAQSLLRVIEEHADTVMSDFTYLQHAQPTTLAHYLLSFVAPLTRDVARLERAIETFDESPLGAGSVNGSRFPIDRDLLASLLGFRSVRLHTRDAMWAPDAAIEAVSMALSVAITTDRLTAELLLWTTSEFGYLEIDDRHSRTSVIMPQKKNPYALTHVRGTCREVVSVHAGVVATQLTPTGQPDNRIYSYEKIPFCLDALAMALDLLAETMTAATFDRDTLGAAADEGYLYATDLCDYLTVSHGVANRDAHRLVGRAVRMAMGDVVTADLLEKAAAELELALPELDEADIARNRDPREIVRTRRTPGGAGPDDCAAAREEFRQVFADSAARVEDLACTSFSAQFGDRVRTVIES